MPSSSSAAARLAAACVVAVAAWVACGTITLASPSGPRVGLLPPPWVLLPLLAVAVLCWRWWRRASRALIAGAVLVVLPWLPSPVPAAFLAWSRPLSTFVAVSALITAVLYWAPRLPRPVLAVAGDPRRAPLLVVLISAALYGGAAWRVAPVIPGGDEPHYLIISQSLLYDFDLRIENNHRRGDYRAYHPGDLRPDYLQRGVDGEIYSVHMPGVSALVAPAFLVGGYPGTVVFLVLLASVGGAVLWRLAWRVTADPGAAWFGWAAAALSVPVVFHSFTVYPDSAGMLLVLIGMAGLLRAARAPEARRPWLWVCHGAALAALPWLHSRLALVAAVLGALTAWCLLRAPGGGIRSVAALFAVPAVSASAWFGFFYVIYGSLDPRAQYGGFLAASSSPAYITSGIGGLLLDPQFGLLPYAPAFAVAFAGVAVMLRAPRHVRLADAGQAPHRLVALTMLLLIVPYLVSTTSVRMWWGGWSAPARFLVPLLPPLGIAAAVAWQRACRRSTRVVLLGSLGFTIATSGLLVWVERGRLAYNVRQTESLWLDWLGPLAELSRGVPTFLRTPEPEAWVQATAWMVLLLGAWLVVRALEGRLLRTAPVIALATVVAFALAGMLGLSFVWWRNDISGVEPTMSQVRFLQRAASGHGLGLTFSPLALGGARELPGMVIDPPRTPASAREPEVAAFPGPLAAGLYAIEPTRESLSGRVSFGIGPEHVPLRTVDLVPAMRPVELLFPVNVRALVVHGDADAVASGQTFVLRPRWVLPAPEAGPGVAVQARRYGPATVYVLDNGAFPEPRGVWIGGAMESVIVVQPDAPRARIALRLRNAPVENQVRLAAGGWREDLALAAGEQRRIEVPLEPVRRAVRLRIRASDGFRPSAHEAGSEDQRFLGVWIEVE